MSRLAPAAVAAATLTTLSVVGVTANAYATTYSPVPGYGPSHYYDDDLEPNDGPVEPMKDQSRLERTRYGYMYTSGQQDNHVVVSLVSGGGIRFRDTGTRSWKGLPGSCTVQHPAVGIAATCPRPTATDANRALIEIHVRLGNDYLDARTLPATYEVAALMDAGRDEVHLGAGNDYINGAQDPDRVWGGGGKEWIRTGTGSDVIHGGDGNDYLVGADDNDVVYGDAGNDQVRGGLGGDTLYTGAGADLAAGDGGRDTAYIDSQDRANNVEVVHRS